MSKDVAQRDLDMNGFRITNAGDPKEEKDFTRVDLDATPKAAKGSGSPGKSLLAAAADHVHPATDGGGGGGGGGGTQLDMSDVSEQAVEGKDEAVVAEFLPDFGDLRSTKMRANFSVLMKAEGGTAKVRVRVGGKPGQPDGEVVLDGSTKSSTFEKIGAGDDGFEVPDGVDLVKVTVANDKSDGVGHVRAKHIRFEGGADDDE
jgi:hypothetical protein